MEKDIADFMSKCLNCPQVKLEHQRPSGLLQQLPILEWKWDMIAVDFVSGLPCTLSGYDAIWVIIDRLIKTAHFMPIKKTYSTDRLARLYINRIFCLYGVLVSIVSDRGATFTLVFWQELYKALGTRLNFSTTFHPQTDGQFERTIQTLEDMLRMCVLDFGGQWDAHFPLIEFAYNNNYHVSIKMAPYEVLYRRKCISTL